MNSPLYRLCFALITPVVFATTARIVVAAEPKSESAAAQQPAPTDTQIAQWVADLDSNQYRVREAATQQLEAASAAAIEPLLSAANSKRPEPADRAVWILRRLGQSPDREVAVAALEGLVALQDRPTVVHEAEIALDLVHEQICQESLMKLGGRMTIVEDAVELGQVQMVSVVLDEHWRGTTKDLQCLTGLKRRNSFKLEGAAVGDAEAQMFGGVDHLQVLKLINTHVTPTAVDAIKSQNPKAIVYMKNRALFGISGASHAQGVVVQSVQPGSAAADAGVMPSDVIMQIDGKPLPDFDRLTAQIAQHSPGDEVEVQILRGEDRMTKRVKLGTWPNVN
jgi:hypothetical protein